MNKQDIINEVITGYRELVKERYQYKKLTQKYELPESLSEIEINAIKDYFLGYIYPNVEKRKELNEAFKTLDNYIKKPEKLLNLILDSFQLIISHGRHLPKIFNAGLKAMKSFRGATKFENALVDNAIANKIKPPFTIKKINNLIQQLPYNEVDEFVKNTEAFFNIIYDKVLVNKIKEIIAFIISKMKKKSNIFSAKEINGLELALETIAQGEKILETLSVEEQEILVEFVVKIERDNLEGIYNQ